MKTWHNHFTTVPVSLKLLFSSATHRAGEYASLTCQTISLISQVSGISSFLSLLCLLQCFKKKKDPVKHNYTPLKEKLTDRNHSDSSIQSLICFGQRRIQENVCVLCFHTLPSAAASIYFTLNIYVQSNSILNLLLNKTCFSIDSEKLWLL